MFKSSRSCLILRFNRISVEVLSVVAVQVKTIQDAIRAKKSRFMFLGEDIRLNRAVGIFITMVREDVKMKPICSHRFCAHT